MHSRWQTKVQICICFPVRFVYESTPSETSVAQSLNLERLPTGNFIKRKHCDGPRNRIEIRALQGFVDTLLRVCNFRVIDRITLSWIITLISVWKYPIWHQTLCRFEYAVTIMQITRNHELRAQMPIFVGVLVSIFRVARTQRARFDYFDWACSMYIAAYTAFVGIHGTLMFILPNSLKRRILKIAFAGTRRFESSRLRVFCILSWKNDFQQIITHSGVHHCSGVFCLHTY